MRIKFKQGAPCPVAAMAGSDLCLGGSCPWYVADLKGCIVGVQAATLTSLIDQVQAQQNSILDIVETLESIMALIEKASEAAE